MGQRELSAGPKSAPSDWSEIERELWEAYRRGAGLDLREENDDPSQGHQWGDARTIRDVVIERLLLHGPDAHPGHTPRLLLAGARITGEVDLSDSSIGVPITLVGCSFDRQVNLMGAELNAVDLSDSHLPRLAAERVHLTRNLLLRGATVSGSVHLFGAHIGGQVVLSGATLTAPHGVALTLERATIDGDVYARKGFTANGEVCLLGVHIAGALNLSRATLVNEDADDDALNLIDAQVNRLILVPHKDSHGLINLRDARVGRFIDDPRQWPEGCRIDLDGFSYERLSRLSGATGPACSVKDRLDWMRRYGTTTQLPSTTSSSRAEFSPTPYELLAAALRRDGQERQARLVARHREHHYHRSLGRLGTLWGIIQRCTVGYGYRPALALAWVIGILTAGTLYFSLAGPLNPVKADEHPTWFPFLYALDLLVPLLDLGHEKAWDPVGADRIVAIVLMVAGWVLVTAFGTGAARTLSRQ